MPMKFECDRCGNTNGGTDTYCEDCYNELITTIEELERHIKKLEKKIRKLEKEGK